MTCGLGVSLPTCAGVETRTEVNIGYPHLKVSGQEEQGGRAAWQPAGRGQLKSSDRSRWVAIAGGPTTEASRVFRML